MKWDVKHDRAKRVIDAFLENAGYWQEREDLSAGLNEAEKALVSEEVALMIASIRKRYKLQERLLEKGISVSEFDPLAYVDEQKAEKSPEQEAQIQPEEVKTEIPTGETEETLPEPVNEVEKEEKPEGETVTADTEQKQEPAEKPKRGRKASGTEKKPAAKKGGRKKAAQEENAETEQAAV